MCFRVDTGLSLSVLKYWNTNAMPSYLRQRDLWWCVRLDAAPVILMLTNECQNLKHDPTAMATWQYSCSLRLPPSSMERNCSECSTMSGWNVHFMHSFVCYLLADRVIRLAVFSNRFVDPLSAATKPLSRPRSLH